MEQAVRLDPRHASAWYRLSICARAAGDPEKAKLAVARFIALREVIPESARTPEALERCRYTRMSGVVAVQAAPAAIPVRFTPVPPAGLPSSPASAATRKLPSPRFW